MKTARMIHATIIAHMIMTNDKLLGLGAFISALKKQEGIIDDFTPELWGIIVDFITVGRKKEIKVTFRDGTDIMAK